MKIFKQKEAFIFAYLAPERAGFWVFDGAVYHRFLQDGPDYYYVRASANLPAAATGNCYRIPPEEVQRIQRTADSHHIRLVWHTSVDACIQAEMRKSAGQYVFGLCDPAASLELNAPLNSPPKDEEEDGNSN
jgi:hypothetical protein